MENDGRMGLRCIIPPDQAEHVQKELATYRLMSVIEQRDAAILERDNAIAEKKAAINERDAAFYQRNLAITERNTAIMERDNAIAALHAARGGAHRALGWNQYKRQPDVKGRDATMLQMSLPNAPFSAEGSPAFNNDSSILGFMNNNPEKLIPMPSQQQQLNARPRKKEAPAAPKVKKERKATAAAPSTDVPKTDLKRKHADNDGQMQESIISPLILPIVPYHGPEAEQQSVKTEMHPPMQEIKELDYVINTPIPHCSCTGTPQPCYRWGNGGWQSACCTTKLSMHPLPMNPLKKGYRLPGRKMSAGAFQKLVKRLAQEGVDLSQPIDLKDYWAKHGTNRYVTIK